MGFLLGLFIGCSIFILGFLIGGGIGLYMGDRNKENYEQPDYFDEEKLTLPTVLTCVLPDFGDFADRVTDCYTENTPLSIEMTQDGKAMTLVFMDDRMHLDDCFNIGNEG